MLTFENKVCTKNQGNSLIVYRVHFLDIIGIIFIIFIYLHSLVIGGITNISDKFTIHTVSSTLA